MKNKKNNIYLIIGAVVLIAIVFLIKSGALKGSGTESVISTGTSSYSVAFGNYPISSAILYHDTGSSTPTGIYPAPSNQAYWFNIPATGKYFVEVKLTDYPLTNRVKFINADGTGTSYAMETVCGSPSAIPALTCRTRGPSGCIQKCDELLVTCNPTCAANQDCNQIVGPYIGDCILKSGCSYNNPACAANQDCISNVCVLKSGCTYGNPTCGSNYNCVSNVCVLKSGCTYNNPTCAATSSCINNICLKINGQSCTSGSECASGNCIANVCTSSVGSFNAETVVASTGVSVSGASVTISGPMIQTKTTSSGIATFSSIAIGTYTTVATYGGYIPVRKSVSVPDNTNHKEYYWFYPLRSDGSGCTLGEECSGGYCNKGICISHAPTTNGGSCTSSSDCISNYCNQGPSGNVCSSNANLCTSPGVCTNNAPCIWNAASYFAAPGTTCTTSQDCTNNVCVLKSGCQYNNPACPIGQTCTNNICAVNLKPDGQSCAQNSECLNNYCFQGICRKDSDGDKNPDYFDSCPNSTANNCLINVIVLPYNVVSFSFIPQIQNIGNTISNLQITSVKFNNGIISFTSETKQTNPNNVATFSTVSVTGLVSLPLQAAGSKTKYTLVIDGKTTSIYYASDTKSAQQIYYFVKG